MAIEILSDEARRWASATFTGARHGLALEMPDDAATTRWLAALTEADLPLPGHLVADIAVISREASDGVVLARIEALTVEER